MINKLIRKRPNRFLSGRNNYYDNGGGYSVTKIDTSLDYPSSILSAFSDKDHKAIDLTTLKAPTNINDPIGDTLSKPVRNLSTTLNNPFVLAAAKAVGQIGGGLIGGGLQSGIGDTLQGLSGIASALPGPWGAVACLCEGQRVITRDGRFVNIEDLTPEDGIIGFSEQTNSISPQTTTLQMLELYKPCVRIELQSGLNLECSTDHPVYIADSGRATRKYVDGIRTRIKTYSYVKAEDIKVGQYAGVIDEVPIFGNLNVEKAYLIGMLIGDGSYTKRSIVALHTGDEDTWNYVESNNYGVVVNRFDSGERYSKEFRTYRIIGGCQMMRELGLYGQSKSTKTLPNNIHLWNKESIANLIAGLWDTDGYVTIESNGKKKHRICFCQSNLSLIRAVQEQLIKFGIHSSIKINKPKKGIIKDKQVNSKEAYVLIIKDKKSCVRFIENIHLNIGYKQRNLDRIKEIIRAKFTKDNSFRQGIHADKIISITPIGVRRIYNLEAHQDHNYIANFIVTHNSAGLGVLSGLTNRMFGSKLNNENIAKVLANIDSLNSFQSNASDFDSLALNWADADTGMTFSNSYIGKDGWFSNKAKNKAADLRRQVEAGNTWVLNSLTNNAENIADTQMLNLLSNYAAFGGNLMTHGADFDTGLILVGNGGTHELNTLGGVPMGVDPEGVPNLVEEGEVIFNDYVFSNRLKVPKAVRKKYKLGGSKYLTFADAAIKMGKESEERPNDPISQAGLDDSMTKLMTELEQIRTKLNTGRKYDLGGELNEFVYTYNNPYLERLNLVDVPLATLDPNWKPRPLLFDSPKNEEDIKTTVTKTARRPLPSEPTWMRYVPAYASGVMSLTDAMGLTNKPDYSEADAVLGAARNAGTYNPVRFNPIGNYLTYRPFDRDYYLNRLDAQAGATRRNLLNTVGGNRATAMAGLLATDYNTIDKMGALARLAEESNFAQRLKIEEFNRGTNITNSEGMLKAASANQAALMQARSEYFKGALAASELRLKERQTAASVRSANLSNFINSLGDIGRENFARNMIVGDPSKYYYIDSNGNIIYKNAFDDLDEAALTYITGHATQALSKAKGKSKSNGGYLTIRKKRK